MLRSEDCLPEARRSVGSWAGFVSGSRSWFLRSSVGLTGRRDVARGRGLWPLKPSVADGRCCRQR
eukprot:6034094-Prymnesium_polylepis.1